jgi:hypothetical protein
MRDVVYLCEGFPPFARLARLTTATGADRAHCLMAEGPAVVTLSEGDAAIADVLLGRVLEIHGYAEAGDALPRNNYPESGNAYLRILSNYHWAQRFKTPAAGTGHLWGVTPYLRKTGSPTGTVHMHLCSDGVAGIPGTEIATSTNTVDLATLTTSYVAHTFNFALTTPLSPDTWYHWMVDVTDATMSSGNIGSISSSATALQVQGNPRYSANKVTWSAEQTADLRYELQGEWSPRECVAPWAGWIDRIQADKSAGTVTVECRDAAGKLAERHSGLTTARSGSAGRIARDVLQEANARNGFGVTWDVTSEQGTPVQDIDVSGSTVLDALNRLAEETGDEWWIELKARGDGLSFGLHWCEQRGFDLSQYVYLRDGIEVSKLTYSQDAVEVAESVLVVGGGGNMAERPAAMRSTSAMERANLSGVYVASAGITQQRTATPIPAMAAERVIVSPRSTDVETLSRIAERDLEAPLGASETLQITVNERADWRQLAVGNIVRLIASTPWGDLNRRVRIIEAQPDTAEMLLEVQVLND